MSGEPSPCQRFIAGKEVIERSRHDVWELAKQRGRQLSALGLKPGDRVGIVVTDPWEFLPLVYGCLLFGFVATPMYPPPLFSRLHAYQATLASILAAANVEVLVTDGGLGARLGHLAEVRVCEVSQLPTALDVEPPDVEPEQWALLQFTSGSTATPRGVPISHRALISNIEAFAAKGLQADARDHCVSWLPLFHDMGLIGFGLAPLFTKSPVTYIPTSHFVRNPRIWLQVLHDVRGTITFAPNFAYALATRRAMPNGLDLSCVRMWGCGAEPVSERVLSDFEQHLASCGVRPRSVAPCYGLAEATLAVTFTRPGKTREVQHIDAAVWEADGKARAPGGTGPRSERAVVSCGTPLPGYAVTIVDERGDALPDECAGEIVVTGPSVATAYVGAAQDSTRTFRDGRLFTGDRGYLSRGQLFVTGRMKDTLILNGRKYDPHVLEYWAEQVPLVRRAVAVNVARDVGEVLVVVVETTESKQTDVAHAVRAQLAANVGVQVHRVVNVAVGSLPRTTSGKLRRGATRALVEEMNLDEGTGSD